MGVRASEVLWLSCLDNGARPVEMETTTVLTPSNTLHVAVQINILDPTYIFNDI